MYTISESKLNKNIKSPITSYKDNNDVITAILTGYLRMSALIAVHERFEQDADLSLRSSCSIIKSAMEPTGTRN